MTSYNTNLPYDIFLHRVQLMKPYLFLISTLLLIGCSKDEAEKESDYFFKAVGRHSEIIDLEVDIEDLSLFSPTNSFSSNPSLSYNTEGYGVQFSTNLTRRQRYNISFHFRFDTTLYTHDSMTIIESNEQLQELLVLGNWSLDNTSSRYVIVRHIDGDEWYDIPWYDEFARTENVFNLSSVEIFEDVKLGTGLLIRGTFEVDLLSSRGEKGSITLQEGQFKGFIKQFSL